MSTGLEMEESDAEVVDNRRRELRIDVEFPVSVQTPVRADGSALELSVGGLRLKLSEDLSHAIQVSLEFSLSETDARIGALADVRWHKKLGPKSDPHWVYGLRFDNLSTDEQKAIRGHIEAVRARRHVGE